MFNALRSAKVCQKVCLRSHDTQASLAVAHVSISRHVVSAYSLETAKASRPRSENPGFGSRKVNFRPFLGTCAYGVFKAILAAIRASVTSTVQARLATWLGMSGKNIDSGKHACHMTYAPPTKMFVILNIHLAPDLAGIRNCSNTAEKSAIMNRPHLPASHPVCTIIAKLLALVSTARLYGNSE